MGTAVIGTIFATQLASKLAHDFPHAPDLVQDSRTLSSAALAALPERAGRPSSTFTRSLSARLSGWPDRFDRGLCGVVVHQGAPDADHGHCRGDRRGLRCPRNADSLAEIGRALSVLVGRPKMVAYFARVASEAGVDLPLPSCWVLVQLRRDPGLDEPALRAIAEQNKLTPEATEGAMKDVKSRGLVGADLKLSPAGAEIADRITTAVRQRLEGLLEGWSPEQYPELVQLLDHFAAEIVSGQTVATSSSAGDRAA